MTTTVIMLLLVGALSIFFVLAGLLLFLRQKSKPEPWMTKLDADAQRLDRGVPAGVVAATKAAQEVEPVATEIVGTPEPLVPAPINMPRQVVEISASEAGVSRRMFFTRALAGSFFSYLGVLGLASLAFFWPKVSGGFGSDVDAGPIAEIKATISQADGSILPVFLPEARAWIVPAAETAGTQFEDNFTVADGLMALWQKCVHLGCSVPWCQTSQGFECPCHGSKYNGFGEYQAGPAPRNLDRFVVEDKAGRLLIKTGQPIETERAVAKSVKYPQGPSCIGAA
jgi:cytochrome b6-f complex iron-sulfur subunit